MTHGENLDVVTQHNSTDRYRINFHQDGSESNSENSPLCNRHVAKMLSVLWLRFVKTAELRSQMANGRGWIDWNETIPTSCDEYHMHTLETVLTDRESHCKLTLGKYWFVIYNKQMPTPTFHLSRHYQEVAEQTYRPVEYNWVCNQWPRSSRESHALCLSGSLLRRDTCVNSDAGLGWAG